MTEFKFNIKGTKCNSCKMLIADILEDMNINVVSFDVDKNKKESKLVVQTDLEPQKIKDEIQAVGDYQLELL